MEYDPRYYATYYAIDAVNFEPVKSPAMMDTIDGAYLPLVIQEAAGIPLDPSFDGAERDHDALPRRVLRLQGRRRGAAFQSAVDRRRNDQGIVEFSSSRLDAGTHNAQALDDGRRLPHCL